MWFKSLQTQSIDELISYLKTFIELFDTSAHEDDERIDLQAFPPDILSKISSHLQHHENLLEMSDLEVSQLIVMLNFLTLLTRYVYYKHISM